MEITDTTDANSSDDDNYGSLDYRNVDRIQLGNFEFNTWFGNSAIFMQTEPEILGYQLMGNNIKPSTSSKKYTEFIDTKKVWINKLHFCPSCFKYTDKEDQIRKHYACCRYKTRLPGNIMYHDGIYTIRKVKGSRHKLFCQCMCILAKFFLHNKSVFFNLDYYDFYIIYKNLDGIPTPMGFYSRELLSWEANNLSCILVIPCYQKQKLGTKLIEFSYHLSNYEQLISGPERPLSPFGKISYLHFWSKALAREFLYGKLSTYAHVTLELMGHKIGFRSEDIILALDYMGVLYETGKREIYTDYYSHNARSEDEFVFLEEENYKVYIVKSEIKKWVIENHVSCEQSLKEEGLVLY